METKGNGDGIDYCRYLSALRETTRREIEQYTVEDWAETAKACLANCPAFIEAALLRLHFALWRDPANDDLNMARQYLDWVLRDIVRAQEIARKL